ncbi:hypothetical protein ACWD8L_00860 [Streptomyces sp. NPDC005133]
MKYQDLGIRPVVTAQANSTPLGGCTLSERVIEAMGNAARTHVDMAELWHVAGEFIAGVTGSEDAFPVIGAAAGMAISTAACITGTDTVRIQRVPDTDGLPNEIVLQKGHVISYGGAPISQMIALGGGRAVEVGAVNETLPAHVAGAITSRTAALVYVTSRTHAVHRRGVSLDEMTAIGREHGIPVIVDAAGEEDLRRWSASGADLVIYSGPKALGAPTSGFVCGRSELVAACRAQNQGVARPMKVGKENLLGLLEAIQEYTSVTPEARGEKQRIRMTRLAERLAQIPGLSPRVVQDESGRNIHRVLMNIDPRTAGRDAPTLAKEMAQSTPAVYLRDFKMHLGQLEVDPRGLTADGEEAVIQRLGELLSGGAS